MKNKIIALSMAMLCVNFNAQSDDLNKDIKKYTARIDSIVGAEKQKMNSEIDVWKSKSSNKEISEQEYSTVKKEIVEKYQKQINNRIINERKLLDSITKKTVKESIFKKNTIKNNKNKKTIIVGGRGSQSSNRTTKLLVSYSLTNLTDKGGFDVFNKNSKMRIGNTHSIEVFLRKTNQLNKSTTPVFIHYGLAYRTDTYMPKRDLVFAEDNDQLILKDFQDGKLKRSKLRNVYIVAPLEFSWQPYNKWEFGIGGYVGVNTRNIIKVKYRNHDDKFKKYKNVIDTGINPYIVGAKASISFSSFTFFLKKDFTPVFDSKANLNFKNNIQFGLVISDIGL